MFLMGIIGLFIRFLSLVALNIISSPKAIKLTPPGTLQAIGQPIISESAKPIDTAGYTNNGVANSNDNLGGDGHY